MAELFGVAAEAVPLDRLRSDRARRFARYVERPENADFHLVACHDLDGRDAVHVAAFAEVPQVKAWDIRREEHLLVAFDDDLPYLAEVLAMRVDFPVAPHLNLKRDAIPRSLCLFGEPADDVRMRWSPSLLGERILLWLRETARGTLHRAEQGLEPFIAGHLRPIVVPPDVFQEKAQEVLSVRIVDAGTSTETMVAERRGENVGSGDAFTLLPFGLPTQVHGVIALEPRNLRELHDLCADAGFDLLSALKDRLQAEAIAARGESQGTILVLAIPKSRETGGAVEAVDLRGFRCGTWSGEGLSDVGPGGLGVALEVLGRSGGAYLPLLGDRALMRNQAERVGVSMLHPIFATTPEAAASMSGHARREAVPLVAVGMGALGSQVFSNLARQAYGRWTLVDDDRLLPHNLVRHAASGDAMGGSKAARMAAEANGLFYGPPQADAIRCDVQVPASEAGRLGEALRGCDAILDFSASVPVARHLTLAAESDARRVSLFLTPDGKDMVLLAEDVGRTHRLDSLEAQYLRAVLRDPRLEGHLGSAVGRHRYGASCRDVSSTMSQELVGLHAAIGARALRDCLSEPAAKIVVWRCSDAMEVRKVDVAPEAALELPGADWRIVVDDGVRRRMDDMRSAKLPRETCGILIGSLDTMRRRIYVVDALPPTPDTVEEPSGCLRGTEGLPEIRESAIVRSHGQVDYVGEWHSHPDGVACAPSSSDARQMAWVADRMHPDGKPGLILIACEDGALSAFLTEPQ